MPTEIIYTAEGNIAVRFHLQDENGNVNLSSLQHVILFIYHDRHKVIGRYYLGNSGLDSQPGWDLLLNVLDPSFGQFNAILLADQLRGLDPERFLSWELQVKTNTNTSILKSDPEWVRLKDAITKHTLPNILSYILQENGDFLLQENGDRLIP
jgi:hypothetical protein